MSERGGRSEDKLTGVQLGEAYVFAWVNGITMTGVAVRVSGKSRWVTFRTGGHTFVVPPQDVLRRAD